MNDVTRREFLSAAGAVAGSSMIGRAGLLHAATAALSSSPEDNSGFLQSLVFPEPQHISAQADNFVVRAQVRILVPSHPSQQDLLLARRLLHELSDRYDRQPRIAPATDLDTGVPSFIMGSIHNPLVRQCCARLGLDPPQQPEGYLLHVEKNLILVAGHDDRGAFWGLQSLRQLIFREAEQVQIRGVNIQDWPDKPFRGIYLYLPGRDNIPFFKRFVRDYMALYKYNTLIMEMGASMRLDRHPELNAGWVDFARDCNYSCRNYPPRPFHSIEQNSSHQDTADGDILEKDEVDDLARFVAQNHIELVPELASFTHSYYLLTRHRDLAAVPEDRWPDIYCASHEDVYPLVFDVYDEYLDLLKPKMVHIGHDELFLPVNVSPQCRDEDIGEIYGRDVRKIHDHLASRGIKTALWGDMLLESVRGRGLQKHVASDGFAYSTPGGMTPEQVKRLIPKDCLVFNWFWQEEPGRQGGNAKLNEETLDRMGFQQVYGNFEPTITDYETRRKRPTLLGGAPSAWFATNEFGFGKELMATFLGCGQLLWTGRSPSGAELAARVQTMIPLIRERLSGITPPSRTESSIVPIDISGQFNLGESQPVYGADLRGMVRGVVESLAIPFDLRVAGELHAIVAGADGVQPSSLPKVVSGIHVGVAPTSVIFLHALATTASNRESFRLIWDQHDTADMLGWYEVVYDDGFVTTVPIRYGVNILEWNWAQRGASGDSGAAGYCYAANAVPVGDKAHPITFFAFEWINPRLGKVIREIRLCGTTGFRGASSDYDNEWGPVIANNAVILRAISIVQKRS